MVNTCECLINVVTGQQAKDADRLEPKKAMWWAEAIFRALSWTINTTGG
jgi:hypothetical protein